MLFATLEKAIIAVEGADVDESTPEPAYLTKYYAELVKAGRQFGWTPEALATAYGRYQILGENLARYHGLRETDLDTFLTDPVRQRGIARKQFYIMLKSLVRRRGLHWSMYLYSMWNAGVNFNAAYDASIRRAKKGR